MARISAAQLPCRPCVRCQCFDFVIQVHACWVNEWNFRCRFSFSLSRQDRLLAVSKISRGLEPHRNPELSCKFLLDWPGRTTTVEITLQESTNLLIFAWDANVASFWVTEASWGAWRLFMDRQPQWQQGSFNELCWRAWHHQVPRIFLGQVTVSDSNWMRSSFDMLFHISFM